MNMVLEAFTSCICFVSNLRGSYYFFKVLNDFLDIIIQTLPIFFCHADPRDWCMDIMSGILGFLPLNWDFESYFY